jgi:hypothetical protein
MNIADQFVVGLVELGEQHNQMHEAEYYKPKTRIQTSNKTQPMNTNSTKQLKNKDCDSKGYRTTKRVYFLVFLVELDIVTSHP